MHIISYMVRISHYNYISQELPVVYVICGMYKQHLLFDVKVTSDTSVKIGPN